MNELTSNGVGIKWLENSIASHFVMCDECEFRKKTIRKNAIIQPLFCFVSKTKHCNCDFCDSVHRRHAPIRPVGRLFVGLANTKMLIFCCFAIQFDGTISGDRYHSSIHRITLELNWTNAKRLQWWRWRKIMWRFVNGFFSFRTVESLALAIRRLALTPKENLFFLSFCFSLSSHTSTNRSKLIQQQ